MNILTTVGKHLIGSVTTLAVGVTCKDVTASRKKKTVRPVSAINISHKETCIATLQGEDEGCGAHCNTDHALLSMLEIDKVHTVQENRIPQSNIGLSGERSTE